MIYIILELIRSTTASTLKSKYFNKNWVNYFWRSLTNFFAYWSTYDIHPYMFQGASERLRNFNRPTNVLDLKFV